MTRIATRADLKTAVRILTIRMAVATALIVGILAAFVLFRCRLKDAALAPPRLTGDRDQLLSERLRRWRRIPTHQPPFECPGSLSDARQACRIP